MKQEYKEIRQKYDDMYESLNHTGRHKPGTGLPDRPDHVVTAILICTAEIVKLRQLLESRLPIPPKKQSHG